MCGLKKMQSESLLNNCEFYAFMESRFTINFIIAIMKNKFSVSLLLFIPNAQSTTSKKENQKWFKQKEWLGSLQLQRHLSVDVQEFAREYHGNQKYWDEAFAFLKTVICRKLAPGKISD
jgi:hypothetical protein